MNANSVNQEEKNRVNSSVDSNKQTSSVKNKWIYCVCYRSILFVCRYNNINKKN
jgi:hypothetical protein